MRIYFIYILALMGSQLAVSFADAQNCSSMNYQLRAEIPSACTTMVMTMLQDQNDKPYLYVANKEAGLGIYDISDTDSPKLVKNIPISAMNGLHVMNLSQSGNYLYLAIGNHFNSNQHLGMAIVDVSDPQNAVVSDYWEMNANGGAGIVQAEGNYAYLGAMGNGLVILDISDKSNITHLSTFKPDINYPAANPNPSLYNARGMVVKNNIVYLCFDAGGLRIVNVSNKNSPVETGRFSNPQLNGKPRAYNNIVVDDTLAYIAVDYCGMEVLNLTDTSHIKLHGWWNPCNCTSANWFTSRIHANEIQYDKTCHTVFMSTGKSDMYAVNVADPTAPDSCSIYGGVSNNIGTWGVGLYKNRLYLSYICTVGIPFASNWTGVKIIEYTRCDAASVQTPAVENLTLFPNPAKEFVTLTLPGISGDPQVQISDMYGRLFQCQVTAVSATQIMFDIKALPEGMYIVSMQHEGRQYTQRLIK